MFGEIRRSVLVEVSLSTGTLKYNFGAQQVLAHKKILGLMVSASGNNEEGNTIQSPADAYLELKTKDNLIVLETPARFFQITPGSPLMHYLPLNIEEVDWPNSTLKYATGTTIGANNVFQMMVIYDPES